MVVPAIYLDECMGRRLAVYPRSTGVDVVTVAEALATSNNDEAQLLYASRHGRVLLSQNQIAFRRLHTTFRQTGRSHGGIILVPQTVPYQRRERRVGLLVGHLPRPSPFAHIWSAAVAMATMVASDPLVDWVSTFSEHRSQLFTWTELQQQIIHGFRLPEWDEEIVRDAIGWRP